MLVRVINVKRCEDKPVNVSLFIHFVSFSGKIFPNVKLPFVFYVTMWDTVQGRIQVIFVLKQKFT